MPLIHSRSSLYLSCRLREITHVIYNHSQPAENPHKRMNDLCYAMWMRHSYRYSYSTHITDAVSDHSAVEEFRAVWDGLPGSQSADVLLSVLDLFHTRARGLTSSAITAIILYSSFVICSFPHISRWLYSILTSLMSSLTLLAHRMSRASLVGW